MGRIITSPEPVEHPFQQSIFLAGGISDCADWQIEVAERLARETQAVIYNPRRIDFDMSAGQALSEEQIKWEYKALRVSAINFFWFPSETLCPITLMEYGSAMERIAPGKLLCGTHPDYKRRFDVVYQTALTEHELVFDDLELLVDATVKLLNR